MSYILAPFVFLFRIICILLVLPMLVVAFINWPDDDDEVQDD
jgi:hypothetical protein